MIPALFRRSPHAPAGAPGDQAGLPNDLDDPAAYLSDSLSESQRRKIGNAIRAGLGEPALTAFLPKVARDAGLTTEQVATEIATARATARSFAEFLRARGIVADPERDPRIVAAEALRGIERRRERLEARLKEAHPSKHQAIRHELDTLDQLEAESFSTLHPASIGSVYGRGPGDPPPGDSGLVPCFDCGNEMNADEKFDWGRCATCRAAYKIRTGHSVPRL